MPHFSRNHYARSFALLIITFFLLPRFTVGSQTSFELETPIAIEGDILAAARNANSAKSCRSCQALLLPLKRLAAIGDDSFVSTMTQICKTRKLQDPDICEGDVGAQGPIIAHALRSMSVSGRTSRLFCNTIFGMCDPEPVEPFNVIFPSPSAPPELVEVGERSRGRAPFQVVHLSDVHIDREYTVGSEANCTKYICCRNFSAGEDGRNIVDPAKPFGNMRCDSPIVLANSMLQAVTEFVPDARFTISTGDVVDHTNWLLSQSTVEDELHGFHKQLIDGLSKSNTFYGSIGNHDAYPTNAFPRTTSDKSEGVNWVFDMLSSDWERWIGTDGASSVQHRSGSYAVVHPGTKLKLISINTQYWYSFNFWLYDSDVFQPDPNGILSFIVSELDSAEKAGQRAYIFGHMPPGAGDAMRDQSNYYDQIVQRYHRTIAGQFYGHTHFDQFQIAYTNYSEQNAENAISFGLVAPSLTPTTNMTKTSYHTEPRWQLYYSARDTYGPLVAPALSSASSSSSDQGSLSPTTPLDAVFWHSLTEVFAADNDTFTQYFARMSRDAPPPIGRKCGDKCRNITICDIRGMRAENSCHQQSISDIIVPPKPRNAIVDVSLSSRAEYEFDAHNACEGSTLPLVMRRLVAWAFDGEGVVNDGSS
ncbi:hypothetical protein EW145_g4471 [Phellinidium pouzarii]|uniref:Sphingomyelin phosphodiesterase n=1 Tax=Phellinidium pouzarii TaxID=167371 RepID=A0A4S4L3C0_9AGAM|nr:hypothetical protein EW145_g4471 [Phellinidium pouzarii]